MCIKLEIIIYSVHEIKRLAVATSACKLIVAKISMHVLIMFMSKFGIQGS